MGKIDKWTAARRHRTEPRRRHLMAAGAERGVGEIEAVLRDGELDAYLPAQAALAEAYLRAGRVADGRAALERALALCGNEAERRRLERKLGDLG